MCLRTEEIHTHTIYRIEIIHFTYLAFDYNLSLRDMKNSTNIVNWSHIITYLIITLLF